MTFTLYRADQILQTVKHRTQQYYNAAKAVAEHEEAKLAKATDSVEELLKDAEFHLRDADASSTIRGLREAIQRDISPEALIQEAKTYPELAPELLAVAAALGTLYLSHKVGQEWHDKLYPQTPSKPDQIKPVPAGKNPNGPITPGKTPKRTFINPRLH